MSDRDILFAAAFLRALATGMIGVLLGIYLARLEYDPAQIGYVIGAGLLGGALAALAATLCADRFGRRRSLLLLSLVSALGGAAFALSAHPFVVGATAFLGMINGMGRDRGASLIIEQAMLPATVEDRHRTRVFAWYNVLQDLGHALGGLLAGLPALLRKVVGGLDDPGSIRMALIVYVLLFVLTAAFYMKLSPGVERASGPAAPRVTPETRRRLATISGLFALDSLAGGFMTTAMLSFFFYRQFGVGESAIGPLFFLARAANAVSHLAAAWLAGRIGLVNTMVFTHIPSSLLMMTVAWAPSFPVAALLFLLREGLVEMDVPTRQSYVMGMVRPEERTLASGVTNIVRVGAWAIAPSFAGLFMRSLTLATPLVIGSGMKIGYDVLLYAACRRSPPPEERRAPV